MTSLPHQPGLPRVKLGPQGVQTLKLMDQSHGHVIPRPDGFRAPCAGPAGCWTCHMERLVYESRGSFFIDQGFVIRPGDKVLLIAALDLDTEVVKTHVDKLKARFPETEFTIMAGYTGVQIAGTNA